MRPGSQKRLLALPQLRPRHRHRQSQKDCERDPRKTKKQEQHLGVEGVTARAIQSSDEIVGDARLEIIGGLLRLNEGGAGSGGKASCAIRPGV